MKNLVFSIMSFCLVGCATCQRHPVVCSVAASVVVSSVIATVAIKKVQHDISAAQAAAAGQQP